jgi:hypothetical protein
MAISNLSRQEVTLDCELHDPNDADKKLGIVFQIRSINNPDATRIMKLETGKAALKSHSKGGKIEVDDIANIVIAQSFDPSIESLATCIVGWNWGSEEIEEGEGPPEFNHANVIRVLGFDWVRDQVFIAAAGVANFMKA